MSRAKRRRRGRVRSNPAPVTVSPDQLEFITQQHDGRATVGDLLNVDGRVARIESIDGRARTIRARPIDGATPGGLDKAASAFRAFSGMEPAGAVPVEVDEVPRVAWLLGELEEVLYNTRRDGKRERYLHQFKSSARPMLAVDVETGRLFVVGGDYRVTDRGITDHA